MIALLVALSILFSKTNVGVVRQSPVDTLLLDNGARILGVAMPTKSVIRIGDLNGDGQVSASDILLLVGMVFLKKPAPVITAATDTSNIQVILPNGKLYNFTRTDGKAVR